MTSASTLIRQASKAKTKAEATKLRALAALMRREARRAKELKVVIKAADAISSNVSIYPAFKEALLAGNSPSDAVGLLQAGTEGARAMHRAEALLKLARDKRTTVRTISSELDRITINAVYDEKARLDEKNVDTLKKVHEANSINIVCGFLASIEGLVSANGGTMPIFCAVSGHTMVHVIEALKQNGYSTAGLKSMSRQAYEARTTR